MLSLAMVALFSATASADTTYEGVETNAWFRTVDATGWTGATGGSATWSDAVLTVDTATNAQYVYSPVTPSVADGYRVTANVTFVRSATAMTGSAPTLSLDAPLAALAATDESWYGVADGLWEPLSGLTPPSNDTTSYSVVFDFKTNGVTKVVRYTVNGTVLTNSTGASEFTCARQPDKVAKVAVAGYGTFENIEGVTASYINIAVADITGFDPDDPGEGDEVAAKQATYTALTKAGWTSGSGKTPEQFLASTGANGKSNWVNYALGLDSTDADAQPFAAPVQTSDANNLTFSLGGVDFDSITASGATVTFTVESADTPNPVTWTPGETKAANQTATAAVPTEGVKYYRIKVTIQK